MTETKHRRRLRLIVGLVTVAAGLAGSFAVFAITPAHAGDTCTKDYVCFWDGYWWEGKELLTVDVKTFEGGVANLGAYGWDNKISSGWNYSPRDVCLYVDPNFQGHAYLFPHGTLEAAFWDATEDLDNKFSSFKPAVDGHC